MREETTASTAATAGSPRWVVGLLALVALLLLAGLQLVEPRFFLRDDNATHFLPAYEYVWETLSSGEIPLLNHHQMYGGTFLASGQTGVFLLALYPLRAALGLLGIDPIVLIDLLATLHFLLAAVGMFAYLRHLSLRPAVAFPLALCWCFLPFGVIAARSWIFVSYLVAYLPWNQWLLQRFLARPTARLGAGLAAVKVLFIFSGYLHFAILAFFYEALFVLVFLLLERRRRPFFRTIAASAVVYLLAGLLAAPLLAPLWKAKQESWERAQRLPDHMAMASPLLPEHLARAQIFRAGGDVFWDLSSQVYFLGPLFIVGLGGALNLLRHPAARPLAAAALGSGIFALLMSTSLYGLLRDLPVFGVLRWPFKSFPLAAFFFFASVAAAAAFWSAQRPQRARLVAGLAWLNLLLQLAVLIPPTWRAPISPFGLDRTVAELRASPLLRPIGVQGRVVQLEAASDPPTRGELLGLSHLYATLAGKYHVHGYDPLRSAINVQIGFDMMIGGALRVASWEELRDQLPRYLIVAATSRLVPQVEALPGARLLADSEGFRLYENPAALPIVQAVEQRRPVPFRWRTNGIVAELPPDFEGGPVLFNVAGLDGYRVFLDGEALGEPGLVFLRPLVEAPPGKHVLELRYVDRAFLLGVGLCAFGLLVLLVLLRRGDGWLALNR